MNRQRRWYLANSDKVKARSLTWKISNRQRVNARARARYWENIEETRRYEAEKALARYARDVGKGRAIAAKYRADKRQATPLWADLNKIADIYRAAAAVTDATGIMHDVDHVIPLRGKKVSGLHCEANLRVIPATANRSKSNKFDA